MGQMPRAGWISGLALVALAGAAEARPVSPDGDDGHDTYDDYVERPIVIAGDPPPPRPEIVREPPPRPKPRKASMGFAAAGMSYAGDEMTPLERFGPQATMGIVHVSHRKEPGFEVIAGMNGGERGRSYTLTARLILTPRLERTHLARPFLALGPAFAIGRLDEGADKGAAAGLGIGPSGAVGLHGFLSHRVYWRASAGFVGAGIGTFSGDLGLGWVIDK